MRWLSKNALGLIGIVALIMFIRGSSLILQSQLVQKAGMHEIIQESISTKTLSPVDTSSFEWADRYFDLLIDAKLNSGIFLLIPSILIGVLCIIKFTYKTNTAEQDAAANP